VFCRSLTDRDGIRFDGGAFEVLFRAEQPDYRAALCFEPRGKFVERRNRQDAVVALIFVEHSGREKALEIGERPSCLSGVIHHARMDFRHVEIADELDIPAPG
jgi:hypothetical protein